MKIKYRKFRSSHQEGLGKWYSKPCLIHIEVRKMELFLGIKEITCSVNSMVVENREYGDREKSAENVTISIDKLQN